MRLCRWLLEIFASRSDRWGRWHTAAVDKRFRESNAEARARGCMCGAPATHVRRFRTAGTVPHEVWTCAAHIDVNGWQSSDGVTWKPTNARFGADTARWQIGPVKEIR